MRANVSKVRMLTQAHTFCLLLVKFLLVRAQAIKLSGVGKMGTYIVLSEAKESNKNTVRSKIWSREPKIWSWEAEIFTNSPLCVASSLLALTFKPFSFCSLRGNCFPVDLFLRFLGRIASRISCRISDRISSRFLVRVLNSFLMRELNLKINL